MENYIAPLKKQFEALADPVRAQWQRSYLKNQFDFYGLTAKIFREALREFFKNYGYPPHEEWEKFALFLWDLPQREYQQVVIEMIHKKAKWLKKEDIRWIEILITGKSWWDTVDGIASWICGTYFINFPEQIKPVTGKWIKSGNMWLQRSALLFQLKYKKNTDTKLLTSYIEQLLSHKDFFIRKAIGWVLREYSKTDPKWVKTFVEEHTMSGLSYREAVKHLPKYLN